MKTNTKFCVSWKLTNAQKESRAFTDADLAVEFYSGVARDPHTVEAKLVEIIEQELRFFEREASSRRLAEAKR